MIQKITQLAWYVQLILLVVVSTMLYGMVWYFVTSGMSEETRLIEEKVAQLKTQNEAARVATLRIGEFRALYQTRVNEYEELKVLLPEQRELTNVLEGFRETAKSSNVSFMRFSPSEDTQKDTIMAKPVEIEVDTNFANLRNFFDQMAKLPRIVSISDFSISQLTNQTASKTLHARFRLSAYYAAPEDLNAKPPAPGTPGAPPPAPGQAAPAAQPPAAQPPAAQPAK